MGSYGIGVGRIMAAYVEQNHDDKGIIFPLNIAPYKVCICALNNNDEKCMNIANKIYDHLRTHRYKVEIVHRDLDKKK